MWRRRGERVEGNEKKRLKGGEKEGGMEGRDVLYAMCYPCFSTGVTFWYEAKFMS